MSQQHSSNIEHDSFFNSLVVFIKGSLIFVVSQAWNSAVQNLIETNQLFNQYGKIYYALAITIIAVYTLKVISNLKKIFEKCLNNSHSPLCKTYNKIN